MGQGVVPTPKGGHGVQTGLGGNAGGSIDLPADTNRQRTQILFPFKTIMKCDRQAWVFSQTSDLTVKLSNLNEDYRLQYTTPPPDGVRACVFGHTRFPAAASCIYLPVAHRNTLISWC